MKKRNMMKQAVAFAMSASMVAGMIPTAALAEEATEASAEGTVVASGEKWTATETADGWIKVVNDGGETLGYSLDSGVTLIEDDGYAFKDLDKDGELDIYEDWREDDDVRAEDLAAQISTEYAMGLMLHGNLKALSADSIESLFGDDLITEEVLESGFRSALNRRSGSADVETLTAINNNVQLVAESQDFGIPISVSTNPASATGGFGGGSNGLAFADNLALAATFDAEFVQEVYEMEAKMYRAIGVTTMLGPMVDIASEPRWNRITGTFGEDPALATDLAKAAITGLQSTFDEDGNDLGWGEDSLNAMVKHWPGDGSGESGRESHSDSGKYTVYPGDNFEGLLIPYVDGALNLDSATGSAAAVMTSYSIAYSDDEEYGELVGTAYSEYKISLLRETYGFDGVICCDWGALDQRGWGTEEYTEAEKIAMMIEAGMDQIGDAVDVDLSGAYEILVEDLGEEAAISRIKDSARRILKTFFQVGLFENSYVDISAAAELFTSEEVAELSYESQIKSIVMLKNSDNTISEASDDSEKLTVYVPYVFTPASDDENNEYMSSVTTTWDIDTLSEYFNVVTDTLLDPSDTYTDGTAMYAEEDIVRASDEELAECDMALILIESPINEGTEGTGYGHDTETDEYFPISLQYGEYVADSEYVREESISGDTVANEITDVYGTTTVYEQENRSYYGNSSRITNVTHLETVLSVAERMPEEAKIVVCVDADGPMIFSEFESEVDAILVGFGINNDYFLDIVSGQVEPSGLLPLQMPANMETVEAQDEDVSRDMECYVDSEGNTYDFAYGMNWSGVIDDERVATYAVEVQTEPENKGVE